MNRLLLEELNRMKNLSIHERGRVISEQKQIIIEAMDDATWNAAVTYLNGKQAGQLVGNDTYRTVGGVDISKSGSWQDVNSKQFGTWNMKNNVPSDAASGQALDSNVLPAANVSANQGSSAQVGVTAADQAEADKFRQWINTPPQTGYKCSDGRNLIAAPGRNFQGPCFKAAWAKFAQSFKGGQTTPADTTTASTTTQDYYVSKPSPSLETAFNDVLAQIGGTGFTTFLYSKRDPDYEAIGSNLTVDQLVQKYGQTFSQYPNAATTIGAPANGVFTAAYATQIKTFEGSQSTTAATQNQITTPEQAQAAIDAATQKAKELKAQTKLNKEVCRMIGRAINPISPLKKGVADPDLCNKLWQCMDQGFIVRGDQKFIDACPKPEKPAETGNLAAGEQKEEASMND
jgi:hypothetical protein